MKKLSDKEAKILKEALNYLLVSELKDFCKKLKLPINGKKGEIIHRILLFLKDGKIIRTLEFPDVSIAKKNHLYPLSPKTRILQGSYKNDDATRSFMKTLAGENFHFTAFGQDWIKGRWLDGDPPTYLEFAKFWQNENRARKKRKALPKREWAYLNFIQRYQGKNPNSSQTKTAMAWKIEREKQKLRAEKILQKFISL